MTAWEIIVLIAVIGLALVCLALIGIGDKFAEENKALREENAELKEKVEALSSADRVKNYYAEVVQEKLDDKLFEKAYEYYDEKMKWMAREDALKRENVELRSELRRLQREPKEAKE